MDKNRIEVDTGVCSIFAPDPPVLPRNEKSFKGKHVVTKISFSPDSAEYLSFTNNETLKVIDMNDGSNIVCKNSKNICGLVSINKVDFLLDSSLLLIKFYHGKLTYQEVISKLENTKKGSYLLRSSNSVKNALSIEYSCDCSMKYHRVHIQNEKGNLIISDVNFDSIDELLRSLKFHNEKYENQLFLYPILRNENQFEQILKENLVSYNYLFDDVDFFKTQEIGAGEFGVVYKGTFKKKTVALKSLNKEGLKSGSLFSEVVILLEIFHPNIVELYAVTMEHNKVKSFAMEWCDNTDLQTYVSKNEVSVLQINNILIALADAFDYLQSRNIVHSDIAARNILLTSQLVPKISDFGLATFGSKTFTQKKMPKRWMAPETLEKKICTLLSDIWSFGVLMWEAYSNGELPYKYIPIEFIANSVVNLGMRLDQPPKCEKYIYDIMLACWDLVPEKRISFDKIRLTLYTINNEASEPKVKSKNILKQTPNSSIKSPIQHILKNSLSKSKSGKINSDDEQIAEIKICGKVFAESNSLISAQLAQYSVPIKESISSSYDDFNSILDNSLSEATELQTNSVSKAQNRRKPLPPPPPKSPPQIPANDIIADKIAEKGNMPNMKHNIISDFYVVKFVSKIIHKFLKKDPSEI